MSAFYPPLDVTAARRVERAITFLVQTITASGNNPKPVVLHSVRVAMHLLHLGHSIDVVVAALLHDVVEDSATSIADIERAFGSVVAQLVEVNTFDLLDLRQAHDYATKRLAATQSFQRASALGKDALLIRAADMLDNYAFLSSPNDVEAELWQYLLDKLEDFIAISRQLLAGNPLWLALCARAEELAT
ncbi:MAG: HD domain-containing protein [Chloroflexi bacterium]|nr:HD domain-containing protein [Chloroflexota bacterium]